MLAFVAGSTIDTGKQVAYLQVFLLPYLLQILCQALYPLLEPRLQKTTYDVFIRGRPWHWPFQGRQAPSTPKRLRKRKKPSVRFRTADKNNGKTKLRTYLLPLAVSLLKVGCRVESFLRCCRLREIQAYCCMRELPTTLTALSTAVKGISAFRFDSDLYPIGIDCHASHCMANSPHLFEDLKLTKMGEVEGIKQGLDIKGVGTFKFKIKDNSGKTHKIRVPNTLYLPELRRCLLSPQHLAQEARDNYPLPRGTWMESDEKNCVLIWGQGKYKKTIPFNPNSNVLSMYSASLSLTYRAFAATFEAIEESFFCREHVLQVPGLRQLECDAPDEQEFVAKENLNFDGDKPREIVRHDNKTIKTSNVTSPSEGAVEEEPDTSICLGALTFDSSPPLKEDKEFQLAATDDQAELMR
jgi:hypothetical protein